MVPARRQFLLNALKLFDLFVMVACFLLSSYVVLRHSHTGLTLEEVLSMRIKLGNFFLFGAFLFAWYAIFGMYGLYGSRRMARRRSDAVDFTKATTTGTFFILLASVVFKITLATPLFLVAFWLTTTFVTIASRLALRAVLGNVRMHGRNLRHMLIVGTNPRAIEFASRIANKPALGYHILG